MQLSEHFKLAEFTRSATASARKIDNTPNDAVLANLKNLVTKVLEPLRQWYGKPITIGSGYRCKALNTAVGGVKNSQHMTGEAADLQVTLRSATTGDASLEGQKNVSKSDPAAYNAELRRLYEYIRKNLPHDQVIMERNTPTSKTYWIHVSCKRDISKNRKQGIPELVKYKV